MRLRLFALICLLGMPVLIRAEVLPAPAPAVTSPEDVALFKDAVKNTEQETERWAYTETIVSHYNNKPDKGETVVRFDPSKPFAEQLAPRLIEGKPPTAKQLKKYRELGEKRGESLEKGEAQDGANPSRPRSKGEKSLKLDLDHPQLVGAEGENCIYRVPLADHGSGLPVDKVEVRVVVHKPTRQIRQASLRVLQPFRLKVVAKVKAGDATLDFAVVDPNYGPVLKSATGSFGASVLFGSVNGTFRSVRTDWKRVKPYNERFEVKIGPLKALDLGK